MTETDPLKAAKERSIEHSRKLARMAGEMLTCAQVAQLLGIDHQKIEQSRKAGKLIAVHMSSDWLYPAFQFKAGGLLPGLEQVLAAYDYWNEWVILDDLLAPDDAFGGRSLLDVIRDGDEDEIHRKLRQAQGDGFG